MLASAFYEVKAFAPYIISLKNTFEALNGMGLKYTYLQVCGDSYVARAKNSIVHEFLKSDYTHLMIIDSDHTWDLEGFLKLLRASMKGYEVVAGLYPCKNCWDFYGGWAREDQKTGMLLGKEEGDMRLLEMGGVPGGFLVYSREAFERTRYLLDNYRSPETNENILEVFKSGTEFDLEPKNRDDLETMTKEELIDWVIANQQGGRIGHHTGEDIWFQVMYKRAGGQLWCEPDIDMGHIGIKEWKGNYQNHLLSKRRFQSDEVAECALP